jgi:uracil-DNA glycosylase
MIGPECCSGGVRGEGDPSFGVMIIGIAPGEDEARRTHRPFTGPAGKLMDKLLEACGWPREKCYCTNSICWWNDEPSSGDLAICYPRLLREIEAVRPKLIIVLGTIVCQHLLGQKLTKVRGVPVPMVLGGWAGYVMPVNHPAAILNSMSDKPDLAQGFLSDLVRDFKKIERLTLGPPVHSELMFELVETQERAQQVLDGLPRDRIVTLDIETEQRETEQIDAFVYDLECLAISNGADNWVFERSACGGLSWPTDVRWTFHNGLFDTAGLHRYLGVDLPIIEDTMLMSYSLDERGGYHGLKPLAREYCWAPFWEERKDEDLFRYNALDAWYTWQLWHVLKDLQIEDDVRAMYTDLLIPAFNMLRDTHVNGVPISRKQMHALAREWMPRVWQGEHHLKVMARQLGYPGDINVKSPQQLGYVSLSDTRSKIYQANQRW